MRALVLCLLFGCGSGSTPSPTTTRSAPVERIAWQTWRAETFRAARESNRMVLVDVGIEGCTACRWMYEDTYADRRVVERVREHFVAVAVDANARPDLGERYSRWGWPATIVLSPTGEQVLAIRGNKRPRNFIPILDELIDRHRRGALEVERDRAIDPEPLPDDGWEALVCNAANAAIAERRHDEAGWDRGFVMVRGAPIAHAMFRAHARNDEALRDHALRTAEAYAALLDPVWGGVFVGGAGDEPIVEKRTVSNLAALQAFTEAYRLTENEEWLRYAADVHRWLRDWMTAPEGMFYASQEDAASGLPRGMSVREYYRLGDAERREHGLPPIDYGMYTDLNGRAIEAYVAAYAASGTREYLEVAERTAEAILRHRRGASGWLRQVGGFLTDEQEREHRMRPLENGLTLYLSAQARTGLGLVALYNATGNEVWLDRAREMVQACGRLWADNDGYYASSPDGTEEIVPRRRPLEDNAAMARLLLMLASFTQDESLRSGAVRVLRAVATPEALRRRGPNVLGEVALAYEWLALGPVELSIVAQPDDPEARALLEAAVGIWEPRKIVHFEPEGRYPAQDRPIVHVCTNDACSAPISEPARLVATVETMRPARGAPCE